MKLHSILMINSGNFSFAHLILDAKSIQLAGRNNKGKTSLLWTLPLLFIVDKKQSTHPNYTPKESLHFYFKNPETSYIIFEGFDEKQGYFYMLLKREGDSVKYFFIKRKLDISLFIKNNTVVPFSKVLEDPASGIGSPLGGVQEILSRAITSKKGEVGFLRLTEGNNSKRFSSLYKHMFRSKNDNELLKNGILVVLGLKDKMLDFKDKLPVSKIEEWKREASEIEILKKARQELKSLKEEKKEVETKKTQLFALLMKFKDIDFDKTREMIKEEEKSYEEKINTNKTKLFSLKKELEQLQEKISELDKTSGKMELRLENINKKLERIKGYDSQEWLKQELRNDEYKRDELSILINKIESFSITEIVSKLKNKNSQKIKIERFIENKSNTLLMHLGEGKEATAIANTVLTDTITSLPKTAILSDLKSSSSDKNTFTYNGVTIDIHNVAIQDVPTIEERQKELIEINESITQLSLMEKKYHQKEALKKERKTCDQKADETKRKLAEIEKSSLYEDEKSQIIKDIKTLTEERDSFVKKIRNLNEEEKILHKTQEDIKKLLLSLSDKNREIKIFYNDYLEYCKKINFDFSPSKILTINNLYLDIKEEKNKIRLADQAFQSAEEKYYDKIKFLERNLDKIDLYGEDKEIDNIPFLEALERQCYGLEQKEEDIHSDIKIHINIFIQSLKHFLMHLESIPKYVRKINKMLSGYTISDLSDIHIEVRQNEKQISDLEQMNTSNFNLFQYEQYDREPDYQDKMFFDYIVKEKKIFLSSLFDIEVVREKQSKRAKSKQSNGTERMLHVMLLLILMREMIHPEDTIPFLIDEVMDIDVHNQNELLKFFAKLNLIPISASPHVAHTFQKIYHIEDIDGASCLDTNTATWKEPKEEENGN